MSTIRANTITDTAGTGAPTFSNGIKTNAILDALGGNTATINGIVPAFLNKQTFTGVGSNTWTKPAGASLVLVRCWGAGGGGCSGQVGGASASKYGGAGGGGGAYFDQWFYASELGATVTVTVGAGGSGGASGAVGTAGGNTTFGSLVSAGGGQGAGPIGASSVAEGGNAQNYSYSTAATTVSLLKGGWAGANANGFYGGGAGQAVSTGGISYLGGGSGGAGGWEGGTNVLQPAGVGGASGIRTGVGTAGTSSAGAPTAGGAATSQGCGGGGGGSAQTANGAAGGAGAFPGGGGGGGGSTRTGFLGGAGGAGANGYCEVYTW